MNTPADNTTRAPSGWAPCGGAACTQGTSMPEPAGAAQRQALPGSRRHPLSELGLGTVLMLTMLCASADAHAQARTQALSQAWAADAPGLTIESCTFATQSCVGEAEQAHAWLPPGAGARALLVQVDALRSQLGLAADVPVRLTCATGQPDPVLIQALQAAGHPTARAEGHLPGMTQATPAPGERVFGPSGLVKTASASSSPDARSGR